MDNEKINSSIFNSEMDTFLDQELEKRNLSHDDFLDLLQKKLGGKEKFDHIVIDQINLLTKDYYLKNKNYVHYLSNLSLDEIKTELKKIQNDSLKYLFVYHFVLARDAYEQMFKNFKNIVATPSYFFASLLDVLSIDFNVDLFFMTKKLGNCKGFIFNLEDGTSHNHRMGIVLTPLALSSSKEFINTLFHELSHRLYYAKLEYSEEFADKVYHEFNAYLFDQFIQGMFEEDTDIDWLKSIFDLDLFDLAEKIEHSNPNFIDETFSKFKEDMKRMFFIIKENYEEQPYYYKLDEIRKMYYRAEKIESIPRKYKSILDFLWFYSSRLATISKLGVTDIEKTIITAFVIVIIYSKRYEEKYHINNTVSFDNIIFSPIGSLSKKEEIFVQNYCHNVRLIN